MMLRRAEMVAVVMDSYGDSIEDIEEVSSELPHDFGRFLLVENNVRGSTPDHWYTTHNTPQDAGAYHVGQEYAEDWEALALWDLDTGEQFDPVVTMTFEAHR